MCYVQALANNLKKEKQGYIDGCALHPLTSEFPQSAWLSNSDSISSVKPAPSEQASGASASFLADGNSGI